MDINTIQQNFYARFNGQPSIYRSPGRINIIGEHTDYNEGFVLPAAIDKAVYAAISKREDNEVHLYASKYNEAFQISLNDIKPTDKQWPNYILGVISEIQKLDLSLGGFNLLIDGDIPGGAGLSSSAALECAVAFALNDQFGLQLEKMQIVLIAQKAEHNFAGVMCGVMDQFASVFGRKNHAVMLDCKSLAYRYVPINMPGYQFVLFNTNVKHNLASSAYNDRRAACYKGVAWVKEHYPVVNSLRDVSIAMLDEFVKEKDADVYQKCKFVVEEIERLQLACNDLEANDLVALGEKMFATHEGLSKQYEVSCKELDFLVDHVKNNPAVLGARMMGGGFGGCTINLIKEELVTEITETLATAYLKEFGYPISTYLVKIENGSEVIKMPEFSV
jgi:galactokinase